jgi:hypothetical protein
MSGNWNRRVHENGVSTDGLDAQHLCVSTVVHWQPSYEQKTTNKNYKGEKKKKKKRGGGRKPSNHLLQGPIVIITFFAGITLFFPSLFCIKEKMIKRERALFTSSQPICYHYVDIC